MSKIKLIEFDEEFFKTIKDYKKVHLKVEECVAYTIMSDNQRAGVIGFKVKEGSSHFLKIGIHQDFRGQDIFEKALDLLVKKHKIKEIHSTVALANIASIKAHEKIGFKQIPKEKEKKLKEQGLLLKRNTRLIKIFI